MFTTIWTFLVLHGTKVLGFVQITLGAIAGATDLFDPGALKGILVVNGVLVAWRGYFNSSQV